jgi:uncharacterized membrane protein
LIDSNLCLEQQKMSRTIKDEACSAVADCFKKSNILFAEGSIHVKDLCKADAKRTFTVLYKDPGSIEKEATISVFKDPSKPIEITLNTGIKIHPFPATVANLKKRLCFLEWNALDARALEEEVCREEEPEQDKKTEPSPPSFTTFQKLSYVLSHPKLLSMQERTILLSTIFRVLSFSLGKLNMLPTIPSNFLIYIHAHATFLSYVSSALGIASSTLLLIAEVRNIVRFICDLKIAKANKNKKEIDIVTKKIIYSSIRITALLIQLTLAIVSIACPNIGLILIILMLFSFIMLYIPESITSVRLTQTNIKYLEKIHEYFTKAILRSTVLSDDEKEKMTVKFYHRTFAAKTTKNTSASTTQLLRDIFLPTTPDSITVVTAKSPTALTSFGADPFLNVQEVLPPVHKRTHLTVDELFTRYLEAQKYQNKLARIGLQFLF